METTFIFHDGLDLPHFATFVLLETQAGRDRLTAYYERFLALAQARDAGFVLEGLTWRANADWGARLGYDATRLRAANLAAMDFLASLRARWEKPGWDCVISGSIGPRGDGYKAGRMDAAESEAYHSAQIAALSETAADLVTAYSMTNVEEAIGIARAARAHAMPCAISFTLETDGRLVTGASLRDAIECVDASTNGAPAYYLINCAHPAHFESALDAGEAWVARIAGIRANASVKSHAELDEATALDAGDPADLGRRYGSLVRRFPALRILGGCCGTDHRHLAAICEACLPARHA